MARTTVELVADIMEVDATVSVAPFIAVANKMTTRLLSELIEDEELLELIERYLTAHFYSLKVKMTSAEGAKGITETYAIKVGLGLEATVYGQQALLLDDTGTLSALQNPAAASSASGSVTLQSFWTGEED
jgi:hypothetical protein